MMFARFAKGILWMLATLLVSGAMAGDWPHYRGPNHDGISTDIIRTNWAAEPPQVIWRKPLSPALSSFAVTGGKAYTQGRRTANSTQREFCIALNADTGVELWAANLDTASYDGGFGNGTDDGPRTTPAVDGDRVYVLTSRLKLFCLDAANGQMVWSNNLVANFGAINIGWQNAASPVVVGDMVVVNCNGRVNEHLLGFRKTDGTNLWKTGSDGMTHASPVVATIDGVRQVVFLAQSGLVGVAPESGNVLWRLPVTYNGTSAAASPVVVGNQVFTSQAYGYGATLASVTSSDGVFSAAEVRPDTFEHRMHWATPVHHQGHLYGIVGQDSLALRCIDLATWTTKWTVAAAADSTPFRYGSTVRVGKYLLVTSGGNTTSTDTSGGLLVLVEATPTAYRELARFRAVTGRCWNVPAVSNGRIYLRSSLEAVCLDVAYPRLKLGPALQAGSGGVLISVADEKGTALSAARASNITVYATGQVSTNPGAWAKFSNAPVLINGVLQIQDTEPATQRFFRAEETP